jgi:hypothetical protein
MTLKSCIRSALNDKKVILSNIIIEKKNNNQDFKNDLLKLQALEETIRRNSMKGFKEFYNSVYAF